MSALSSHGDGDGNGNGNGNGDPGDKLQEWSSLIGIITAIVGNVLIALALNVQRYAHIRLHKERKRNRRRAKESLKRSHSTRQAGSYGTVQNHDITNANSLHDSRDTHDDHESDPLMASFHSDASNTGDDSDEYDENKTTSTYLKSPYWWLGQVLITLGEMGNFLAYGFAPASIVSPLGVVALISNCIIAPAMFHERFRQRDAWGVVIAVAGVVTVVLSAKQEETKLNPHDVWDAITTLAFEIYLGVTILLIAILMWASPRYGRRTILIDLGLVGLFGGYTALATKGVSSMLSSTLWRAFATPVTYALILVLLLTAIMQIRYVNKALQRFDSTQVIPIQFVMFTLCVIIGSAVLYRDFERTTTEQAAKFVGGCLLTFFGVFLVTSGREQGHDDDDDMLSDDEEVEETIGLANQDGGTYQSVQGGPEASTPKSQSRRSSRLSQQNYADGPGAVPVAPLQNGGDVVSVKLAGSLNSQASPFREFSASNDFPWHESRVPSTPPGRGARAYSTESVFAAMTPGADVTTGLTGPSISHPTTPMKDVVTSQGHLGLRPTISPSKPGTHHRSRTFISPSPLSSTVTAVVKDAFLRANDDPRLRRSSMRRIRSSIRAGLFFNNETEEMPNNVGGINADHGGAPSSQSVVPASTDTLPSAFVSGNNESANNEGYRRRARSASDTLGEFLGIWRNRPRDGHTAGETEDGATNT